MGLFREYFSPRNLPVIAMWNECYEAIVNLVTGEVGSVQRQGSLLQLSPFCFTMEPVKPLDFFVSLINDFVARMDGKIAITRTCRERCFACGKYDFCAGRKLYYPNEGSERCLLLARQNVAVTKCCWKMMCLSFEICLEFNQRNALFELVSKGV